MNKILRELEGKKILILGFGREGESTLRFLKKWVKDCTYAVADMSPIEVQDKAIKVFSGKDYLNAIDGCEVVFKTPGIPNKLPEIKRAKENGIKITSQTKLFFDLCQGNIIGVTGTKGKSTTTTLIYWILKKSGRKAILLGNIGKPCLDYLDNDFGKGKDFVFEMSAHQLSDLEKSPQIAVFLNIFKEHLDYYEDYADYIEAKAHITLNQKENDIFVYNSDFDKLQNIAEKSKAKKLSFSLSGKSNAFISNNSIFIKVGDKTEKVIDINSVPLKGAHNLNNVMAASLAAFAAGIPTKEIGNAIKSFEHLEHRLDVVGTYRGITFIDDSLATIPEATMAAMRAFDHQVGSIILGGTDRGQDFKNLAKEVVVQNIETVILFPPTGERIWKNITDLNPQKPPKHFFVQGMKEAVEICYKNTPKGKVCLMSSAAPSFGVFKNYEDKAEQFRENVRSLKIGNSNL